MDIEKRVNNTIRYVKNTYFYIHGKNPLKYELILLVKSAIDCCGASSREAKMKNMEYLLDYILRDFKEDNAVVIVSLLIVISLVHRNTWIGTYDRDSETNSIKAIIKIFNLYKTKYDYSSEESRELEQLREKIRLSYRCK